MTRDGGQGTDKHEATTHKQTHPNTENDRFHR